MGCYESAIEGWDNTLNVNYKALKSLLPSGDQSSLVSSQKEWLNFRNAEYAFSGDFFYKVMQGTMYRPIAAHYAMRFLKDRALQMANYVSEAKYEDPDYSDLDNTSSIDGILKTCLDVAYVTNDMIQCYAAANKAWDVQLNKVYKEFSSAIPSGAKTKLVASQKAWLKYRDNEIAFSESFATFMNGTMHRPVAVFRTMNLTKLRVQQLKTLTSILKVTN